MRTIVTLSLVALAVLPVSAAAGGLTRHSGSVVSVDVQHQALTLEEMGPWHGPGTGLVKRTVRLAPSTAVELVSRTAHPAAGQFEGAFGSSPLKVSDLRPGDFVTVAAEREGDQLVARDVTIARPPTGGA